MSDTLATPTEADRAELVRANGRIRRVLRRFERFFNEHTYRYVESWEVAGHDDATVVTSQVEGSRMHAPVLDLDIEHALVASSTPGHSHLYLNVEMTWEKYRMLLCTLAEVGIVSDDFARVSIEQGFSSVRVPGLSKNSL